MACNAICSFSFKQFFSSFFILHSLLFAYNINASHSQAQINIQRIYNLYTIMYVSKIQKENLIKPISTFQNHTQFRLRKKKYHYINDQNKINPIRSNITQDNQTWINSTNQPSNIKSQTYPNQKYFKNPQQRPSCDLATAVHHGTTYHYPLILPKP